MNILTREDIDKLIEKKEKNESEIKELFVFLCSFLDVSKFYRPVLHCKDRYSKPSQVKINTKRFKSDYVVDEDGLFHYYLDLRTQKEFNSFNEIKKEFGTRFCILDENTHFEIAKYIKSLDLIAIYSIHANTRTNVKDYFVNSVTLIKRKENGNLFGDNVISVHPDQIFNKSYLRYFSSYSVGFNKYGLIESLRRSFKKMYGTTMFNFRGSNIHYIDEAFEQFMSTPFPICTSKNKARQKKIDELLEYPLEDVQVPKQFYKGEQHSYHELPTFTKISRVKKDTSCIRWFAYSHFSKEKREFLRIYVEKNEIYSCRKDFFGNFYEYDVSKLNSGNFDSCYMYKVSKKDVKGTTLEYFINCINNVKESERSQMLLVLFNNPILEQLSKVGFSKEVSSLISMSRNDTEMKAHLRKIFDTDKKSLYDIVRLNKHQIQKITKRRPLKLSYNSFTELEQIINCLQKVFCTQDLRSIDDATFDHIFDVSKQMAFNYHYRNVHQLLYDYNKDLHRNFINNIFDKYVKLSYNDKSIYYDYVSMISQMNAFGDFKISFADHKELRNMHDLVTALYNAKKNKYMKEAFVKNIKKCDKYEFESEFYNLVTLAPKDPIEVTREGIELKHCVKSYIPKIIDGKTNIMFIRKKDDPKTPFFTVEISNDGTIEQIHGLLNRNIDTEPNMDKFVKSWCKNKKLKLNDINKIR